MVHDFVKVRTVGLFSARQHPSVFLIGLYGGRSLQSLQTIDVWWWLSLGG